MLDGHVQLVATKLDDTALDNPSVLSHVSVEDSSTRSLFGESKVLASLSMLFYNWVKNERLHREKKILNHVCFDHFLPLQCDNKNRTAEEMQVLLKEL